MSARLRQLQTIPQQILDGLITHFSEQSGRKHAVTEKIKAKLWSWICLLYLTSDGYSVEVGRIAKDLKMEPAKVATYYKQLGCNVKLKASPLLKRGKCVERHGFACHVPQD
ncbi:hypothetical protein I350_07608 [Cryptococcus amylolentus CBS 6273]|nr:hypothetical protein I350_07608 [Cryptococcus amylolentus CBS 6273]